MSDSEAQFFIGVGMLVSGLLLAVGLTGAVLSFREWWKAGRP